MSTPTTDLAMPKRDFLVSRVHWEDERGNAISATPESIKTIMKCPDATDEELWQFMMLCKSLRLNPLANDAYLVKYQPKRGPAIAQLILGKSAYTKRSEADPRFYRLESGIILDKGDDGFEHRKGNFYLSREANKLVGGWAKVYFRDAPAEPRFEKTVGMHEYNTKRSVWNEKPGTMIEKVAIVQVLREAFPSSVGELGDDIRSLGGDVAQVDIERMRQDDPPVSPEQIEQETAELFGPPELPVSRAEQPISSDPAEDVGETTPEPEEPQETVPEQDPVKEKAQDFLDSLPADELAVDSPQYGQAINALGLDPNQVHAEVFDGEQVWSWVMRPGNNYYKAVRAVLEWVLAS